MNWITLIAFAVSIILLFTIRFILIAGPITILTIMVLRGHSQLVGDGEALDGAILVMAGVTLDMVGAITHPIMDITHLITEVAGATTHLIILVIHHIPLILEVEEITLTDNAVLPEQMFTEEKVEPVQQVRQQLLLPTTEEVRV